VHHKTSSTTVDLRVEARRCARGFQEKNESKSERGEVVRRHLGLAMRVEVGSWL
jgi:hypothetical protein